MDPTAWISAISIAFSAVIGFLNFVVISLLTVTIYRHSVRSGELEILRRNSDQWQKLNLAFIASPHLQRVLDAPLAISGEDRDIHRNLLFYILNALHEIYEAQQSGLINAGLATRLMRGQMDVLKPHAAEVETLLKLRRGYDEVFCTFVQSQIAT
ncbi:MAG: hypothetical protein K2X57_06245 [Xanthobacteraceae bacterium]|nr:hypothetical protein [Xanthobacteraceae bacterium]MBY0613002.1 hypothetical protein [Beijerinckiaceae bacterium]